VTFCGWRMKAGMTHSTWAP